MTAAPQLMGVYGAGPDTVAQLLITAGDNPVWVYQGSWTGALS